MPCALYFNAARNPASDLDAINHIHEDFQGRATSGIDTESGYLGRAHGGLAILWRQSTVGAHIHNVHFDKSHRRQLGITLKLNDFYLTLFTVHLTPNYGTLDSFMDFTSDLTILQSTLEDIAYDAVVIAGDYNVNYNKPTDARCRELTVFCDKLQLHQCDKQLLPDYTFTYLSPAHNTTSWLDHFCMSSGLSSSIRNINVDLTLSSYDHMPMSLSICIPNLERSESTHANAQPMVNLNWEKCSEENIRNYAVISTRICQQLVCSGQPTMHEIASALSNAAKLSIKTKVSRDLIVPGWNDYVKQKYNDSRQAFKYWVSQNRPRNGIAVFNMRKCRMDFKRALAEARRNANTIMSTKLAEDNLRGNSRTFWRTVKRMSKRAAVIVDRVDSAQGEVEVAELWTQRFKKLHSSVDCSAARRQVDYCLETHSACDDDIPPVSMEELQLAIAKVSLGKNTGPDNIQIEHIIHAGIYVQEILAGCITALFQGFYSATDPCLNDSYLIPLVKNTAGDLKCSNNYRGIAINSCLSKVVEHIIVRRCKLALATSSNQFGFKQHHSTITATHIVTAAISIFTAKNSHVYTCFVDAEKAFDRVNPFIAINQLLDRGAPLYIAKLLYKWYTNSRMSIRWGQTLGSWFPYNNGVRQGSCLSPLLFGLYIDKAINKIKTQPYGLYWNNAWLNILAFADDIILLAPTLSGLQHLLDVLIQEFDLLQIRINVTKTKCMVFPAHSKRWSLPRESSLMIGDQTLERVEVFKYLGILLQCDRSSSSELEKQRRKLFRKSYAVINKFSFTSIQIMKQLLASFCFDFYGCELWDLNSAKTGWKKLRTAYHNVIKRTLKLTRIISNHVACGLMDVLTLDKLIMRKQVLYYIKLYSDSSIARNWVLQDDAYLMKMKRLLDSIGCNSGTISSVLVKRTIDQIDFLYL